MRELLRHSRFLLLALLVLVAIVLPGSALAQQDNKSSENGSKDELPTFQPPSSAEVAPDQVIVKFQEDAGSAEKSNARSDEGLAKKKNLDIIDAEVDKVRGQSV